MNDPTKLDMSDYFSAAVTGLVAGVGGAMAWFINSKNKLTSRMDLQEEKMNGHAAKHYNHETQLAVIHTNQDHMSNRLDEIRLSAKETISKLGDLSDTLTQVLLAVKKK